MPAMQVWITSLSTLISSRSGIPWKVTCSAPFTIAKMLFFKTTKKISFMHKPIQSHKVPKRQSIVNKICDYWLLKDILPRIYGSEEYSPLCKAPAVLPTTVLHQQCQKQHSDSVVRQVSGLELADPSMDHMLINTHCVAREADVLSCPVKGVCCQVYASSCPLGDGPH